MKKKKRRQYVRKKLTYTKNMSLGIALAGGGLKGVAHIGVLRALEELQIKPDYISGTSSGSIIAVMYAMGFETEEMKTVLNESYKKLTTIQKRPIVSSIGTYLIHKDIRIEGLMPGEKIENLLKEIAIRKNINKISDIKMPLAIATVDTISTKECIFMSKKYNLEDDDIDYIYDIEIGKAVRASMSLPGIFTTCNFEKYNFIDGGTKDNLPVKVLQDMGAEKILGISFKIDDYNPEGKNIFNVLLRTVDIFSLKDVRKAQKQADLAIEIDASGTSLLDIDDIDKCLEVGYNTIMNRKEEILKLLDK